MIGAHGFGVCVGDRGLEVEVGQEEALRNESWGSATGRGHTVFAEVQDPEEKQM